MTTLDLPLFATPETRRALDEARAVAILVGSYDGSGNYGDIAQLDAGLRLLEPLAPGLLVLPVLERIHLRGHEKLLSTFQCPPSHPIYFDPEHAGQDELLPVAVPPSIGAAAIYLYGGGYLNPSWGARKLAMVRTGEDLLRSAGVDRVTRLSSGLQVDGVWLDDLSPDDNALLSSFEFLGARDPLSAEVFSRLGSSATVVETGDDALGVIPALAPSTNGSGGTKLDVNLHFGGHQWVSGRPDDLRDYTLDFLTELGRRSGQAVQVRPLIAYEDSRIDEGPGVSDLVAEGARRGIAAEEPRVMRPATLPTMLPELREAQATISCSYHVALTSLLLGIPTVFFADNPYYEQKAAGLLTAFGLPSSFALSPGSDLDPVVAMILDEGPALREKIVGHGREFRDWRTAAEAELLGRFAGGVVSDLAAAAGSLDDRLRERSGEPAELRIDAAALRTEVEELRRPALQAAVEAAERATERAEERARQADERAGLAMAENAAAHQRLAEVFGSRTWRLASPLRRIGAALRRLRRRRG